MADAPRMAGDPVDGRTRRRRRGQANPPVERAREGRAALIVLLALALLGLVAADRLVGVPAARPLPEVFAGGLRPLSSSWFCGFGTAAPGAQADAELILTNPTGTDRRATVTVYPEGGAPVTRAARVDAWSRTVLRPRDVAASPFAAAVVEAEGGGVTVEQGVSGPLGFDLTPCGDTASSTWHFAEGSTTKASTMLIGLLNPFPDDAIVDMSFATEQGVAVPAALQGVVVPPRSLVVRNVGDFVRRREAVATTIDARRGRLVAYKLQLRNDPGQRGITLGLGAPSPASLWHFAEGNIRDGVVQRYHLYNPGSRESRVDIELTLDEGAVEPIGATVAPGERTTIVTNEVEGIPKGVGMSAVVRVLNGVPVVVERTLDMSRAPQGRTTTLGARRAARSWALGAGAATDGVDDWVIVHNTSARETTLTVTTFGRGQSRVLDRLGGLRVPAGGRRGYRLNDVVEGVDVSVRVDSTEPVVVERGLYRVGRLGISAAFAIPLR